jgi:N12 class adenine-specific DNA methylase
LVPTRFEGLQAKRIKGMLGVRDATLEALRAQVDGSSEAEIAQAREKLNKVYDKFVKEHGPLSARVNAGIFRQDPDAPRLLALEYFDHKTGSAKKAEIFHKTLGIGDGTKATSAGSSHDALAISMSEEGGINWDRIASLTGKSVLEAQRDLEGTSVFRNPESAAWEPADQYLSGNVRAKLKAAEAAAKADPSFKANADALRRVLPEEIPADQIGIRKPPEAPRLMGATWIEPEDYARFVDFITQSHGAKVAFDETTGTWFVDSSAPGRLQGKKIADLVEDALNQKTAPKVTTEVDGKRVVDPVATTALADEFEKIKDSFAR